MSKREIDYWNFFHRLEEADAIHCAGHRAVPELSEDFQYPTDNQANLLRDYFRQAYGKGLTENEIRWLADLVTDFLCWSGSHAARREMRVAGLRMLRLLSAIDEKMANSRDPERDWLEIAYALGLNSAAFNHLTGAELANSKGLTPMAVSKSVHRFLQKVDMQPAFSSHGLNYG